MNPTNYIEIDSTYRDRKKFPSPGEFEVQFARAAQTDPLAMADAVSMQANIVPGETQAPWNLYTLNEFADIAGFVQTFTGVPSTVVKNIGQVSTTQLSRQRETVVATVLLFDPSSDNRSFYVKQYVPSSQPAPPNRPQVCWLLQQIGAYNGCIIAQYNPYSALPPAADALAILNNKARILSYEYVGHGVAKIILDSPLQIPVNGFTTVPFYIQTMTRPGITDEAAAPNTVIPSQSGEIFVQFGSDADQAYTGKYLINESKGQYRKIESYDGDAHLVTLDLTGQPAVSGAAAAGLQETVLSRPTTGPITRWEIGDNLSIRIDPPGDYALLGLTSTRHSTNTGPATQVIVYLGGRGYAAAATVLLTRAHGRSGGTGLTVTVDDVYTGTPQPGGFVQSVSIVAGGDNYRPGDCVSITNNPAVGTDEPAFLIVTQVDTNLDNPASAADAAELYPLNPSRTTFFIGEDAPGLLGSGMPSLKIGDFIEPFFGSQMYKEVVVSGIPGADGSIAYKDLLLTQIGTVTDNTACHSISSPPAVPADLLTNCDCMVNVGARVTGSFTVTGGAGVPDITVPLMPTTTVVGISYEDDVASLNRQIFISPQFSDGQNGLYPEGVLLPTGTVTNVEFHGGLARPFAADFQANTATPRASLVMFPTGEQALYNNAYVGMKLCLTAPAADSTGAAGDAIISDPIIGNPTTEIEGVITSYDYVTRTITVDPPLDVGTNNFTAMIIPPRESRQILRYAHFNGLLTESVARGSRTIVFPSGNSGPAFFGSASGEDGYYNDMYIVIRPSENVGMPGEIRTIISYDGKSRTATLDRPLNSQYTTFDAIFSAAPEPCEGDYVAGSNEFEVYFSPAPRNPPYYVVSAADIGRLALSCTDSVGATTTFPAGSYISQITSGAPGSNLTCTIVEPDGSPVTLGGAGGANAELQLGEMPSPYFYINSGVVSRAFTAPLPLNLLQPNLNSGSAPTANQLAVMMGTNYDNEMPLLYSGSMVSQQEMVCYEITLINLVLPNAPVLGGNGGRIAFYPYVYVQLENVTSPSGGNSINIYSNNPNSRRMLFRAAIDDVNNPGSTPFIKINSDGQSMTVKFKPNDNLRFSVHLPDGTVFDTVLSENPSPEPANPYSQLSAMFAIRRIG